jgi:hypothetical protein
MGEWTPVPSTRWLAGVFHWGFSPVGTATSPSDGLDCEPPLTPVESDPKSLGVCRQPGLNLGVLEEDSTGLPEG